MPPARLGWGRHGRHAPPGPARRRSSAPVCRDGALCAALGWATAGLELKLLPLGSRGRLGHELRLCDARVRWALCRARAPPRLVLSPVRSQPRAGVRALVEVGRQVQRLEERRRPRPVAGGLLAPLHGCLQIGNLCNCGAHICLQAVQPSGNAALEVVQPVGHQRRAQRDHVHLIRHCLQKRGHLLQARDVLLVALGAGSLGRPGGEPFHDELGLLGLHAAEGLHQRRLCDAVLEVGRIVLVPELVQHGEDGDEALRVSGSLDVVGRLLPDGGCIGGRANIRHQCRVVVHDDSQQHVEDDERHKG
mmetsp:Transcript_35500/g.102071  ORF Transcript_35500/g.102071 Transcript_35500/m.102071 type:complete len:305 (-) Transcript_35500:1729-2643(-)